MNLSWSGPTELVVAGPVCQRQRLPGGFRTPHTPSRADILWMGLLATLVQVLTKATQSVHRRPSLSHSGFDPWRTELYPSPGDAHRARAGLCTTPLPQADCSLWCWYSLGGRICSGSPRGVFC